MMRVPLRVLVPLLFLFVGGLAITMRTGTHPYPEATSIGQGVANFQQLSDRFAALAKAKGAVYAFDVLRIAHLPSNADVHLLAHAIGDVLYQQQGPAGMAYCTQDFRNACSHAIVIGALNEYGGEKALALIRDACTKAPGGPGAYTMCFHGLGHGVFAFYEYDLAKTVAFCKKTATPSAHNAEYPQCVGGAIMELIDGGGHDHDQWLVAREKYFDPRDPLAPCDQSVVPETAKNYCYIYLTPHLFELAGADLGHPDPATFPKAFSYCDAIAHERQGLRDVCFGGFGKEFVPLAGARDIRSVDRYDDGEYTLALDWCDLSAAPDGRSACVRQALGSVFWGGENDPSAAFRFCSLATGADRKACYNELAKAISMYLPKRQDLCQRLPEADRSTCADRAAKPMP